MGMSEAKKSGGNSGRFVKGGDPRQGRGPAKGAPNAGRPPDEFRAAMRELASRDEALAKVREVLNTPDHPHWLGAYRFAAEHGYGKPAQPITGPDGEPLTIRLVRE